MSNDEPTDAERREILRSFDATQLELILLPTEQCNFRCTYCYENFAIGRMSNPVIRGVKRLIERRIGGLQHLRIQWFGGEPLAAKDICLNISEHAYHLAKSNHVEFEGRMTTNGSLLKPELLAKLVALRQVSFHISLDGDKDAHDLTRVRANGSGTFDKIWSNLIQASKTTLDFKVLLRLHITRSNVESMERLLKKLNDTFGGDPRFSSYFHSIENLGGPHARELHTLSLDEYHDRVKRLLPLALGAGSGAAPKASPCHACYAAKANSFVIRSTGRVNKCTVLLSNPRNDVGRLTEDGRVLLDVAKIAPWMEGFRTRDWDTLRCPAGSVASRPIEHNIGKAQAAEPLAR